MRRFRRIIDGSLAISGTITVFLAVVLISDLNLQARIITVLVGVLMIQAGVWKLTSPFMRNDRKYPELRKEVDEFIVRVRSLNEAAVEAREVGTDEPRVRCREIRDGMHESVDRMAELAGKTESDEPTEVPPPEEA